MRSLSAVAVVGLLAVCAAAQPSAAQPSAAQGIKFDTPKFNTPQIAEDMAKLKISKNDLSEMFNAIDGITRWPNDKVTINLTFGTGFDDSCRKKIDEQFDASIAELHRRASTRFERVAADKAQAIIEIADVQLLDKHWQAASKLPGAAVAYKAPRNTSAVRWDMATVWYPQKHEMVAGYAYEGVYFAQNKARAGVVAPCQAFPMTWWLVHISKPHDRPLLNFMIPRDFSFADAQLYDIMNYSIMNSEGVKPGAKGKDVIEALKAALP
jgi:hypothetical protein